jgi:phosphoribosylformimino-5-aminoimidazole carboxamide ribotide isomerase
MRQVCTVPNYQGKGFGKLLLQHCETWAKENHCTYMYCHAREQAMKFYLQNAYQVKGEMFTEVGLPHFYLYKHL